MNLKIWVPLLLAGVLGVVAAKVGRDALAKNRGSGNAASAKQASLVVTARDINPGTTLTAADLKLAKIAATAAPSTAFGRIEDAVGRVTSGPLGTGQVMFESLLAPKSSGTGVAALIPEGMRAVSLEVNEFTGVAGLIVPGSSVDVITTLHDEKEGAVTRTIVQNAKVVAVGQRTGTAGVQNPDTTAKSVTILTTPQESEALELATTLGRTRLVLRSGLDDARQTNKGVSVAELLGVERVAAKVVKPVVVVNTPATKPAEDPTVRRTVQVIRAGNESSVSLIIKRDNKATGSTAEATVSPVSQTPRD